MAYLPVILLLVFCGVAVADQTLAPVPGRPAAPDFNLPDTGGKLHRLSDYRGRPVIINFWATWCPPCREEIPSMNRAWRC
jgi:thiol-disulfide isomerase/thioredoxin